MFLSIKRRLPIVGFMYSKTDINLSLPSLKYTQRQYVIKAEHWIIFSDNGEYLWYFPSLKHNQWLQKPNIQSNPFLTYSLPKLLKLKSVWLTGCPRWIQTRYIRKHGQHMLFFLFGKMKPWQSSIPTNILHLKNTSE